MTKSTRKDNSTKTKNVHGLKIVEHPVPDYDPKDAKELLDLVFHDLRDDEHIATFHTESGQPSYPASVKNTITKIKRAPQPTAFYYGTSSLYLDADGKVYNRKAQFAALHVVVLDDIGTKIDPAILPEDLIPNYIIETSAGNFQWGFVLAEPLRDIQLADALIHLVYTSGYSDSGGKLATKAVRLPAGVNCKKNSEKFLDPVKLIEMNNEYWTPEELVKVIDVGVTWAQVLADPSKIIQAKNRTPKSLSPWAAVPIQAESGIGIVDSMLEYLYSENMIIHDNGGDFVAIECPWCDEHTNDDTLAGYAPLGRGDEYPNSRGFNCFHGHCADRTTLDFLQEMAKIGAPEVPVRDEAALLVRDYVYDSQNDTAIKVANCAVPITLKMRGFERSNGGKVIVPTADGKTKLVSYASLWQRAPNLVTVMGSAYDPTEPNAIMKDAHGTQRLNTFREPTWGDGVAELNDDVKMFLDIAHFIMPNEDEFDYFMQWLAAKVCDRTFKGNAILMVATTQGIGRTMFTDLIKDMFTRPNCATVTFQELTATLGFNEWQSNLMVFCDEVMTDRKKLYSAYETLKDRLDPRPKEVLINVKHGSKSFEINYASYMLLTNHEGAVGALRGDRRIYVISNPKLLRPPQYYTDIETWRNTLGKDGKPAWIANVWRWLREQPYDLQLLNQPVPETTAKVIMQEETDGVEEKLIRWCYANIAPCLPNRVIRELLVEACDLAGVDPEAVLKNLAPALKSITLNASNFSFQKRVNGRKEKFRISKEAVAKRMVPDTNGDKEAVNEAITESASTLNTILKSKEKHLKLVAELAELVEDVL